MPAPRSTQATLGGLAIGHDNNLNLLRVVAATMVLVSHSFVLATGRASAEPWLQRLGTTPGGIAVDVFFVVSGFLVTASLQRSASLRRFAAARALRIYPALWVSLLLTALMVGLWFSELPFAQFLREPQTWRWLGRNALMATGEAALPQAFLHVPQPGWVNGSLWTLRWELRCYLVLALLWWAARRLDRGRLPSNFGRAIVAAALVLSAANLVLQLRGRSVDYIELAAMFFQGSALWVLRERVTIGWPSFAALAFAYVAGAWLSPQAFELVDGTCLGWLALHLAYLPGGLRAYNRLGDYSYGIYIFAFPIQQAILTLRPGLGPWGLVLASAACTAVLAAMSWHGVEARALAHKDWLARRLGSP